MNLIEESLQHFAELHTEKESDHLTKINTETWQKVLNPRMLSGHLQGRFLSLLSHMNQPNKILEIGTFTAYATICLAEGLAKDGEIHTIEKNEELTPYISKAFETAGITHKANLHIGDAVKKIKELSHLKFDMIFIDADKENYPLYLELTTPLLNTGGILIVDNVLWSGKVIQPISKNDKDTPGIVKFCKMIQEDDRYANILLPIRDGIMVARKR